jgi:hypothetical protein
LEHPLIFHRSLGQQKRPSSSSFNFLLQAWQDRRLFIFIRLPFVINEEQFKGWSEMIFTMGSPL